MLTVCDNGQQLLSPSAIEWVQLLRSGELNGRQLSPTFLWSAQRLLPVVANYAELSLTILDLDHRHFLPRLFLQLAERKQRVFLEILQCLECEWSGWTAEPLVADNYVGLPLALQNQLLQQALTLPLIPCPSCGAKLPRHAVWVGR